MSQKLSGKAGQATVEYLVIAMGVLIAIGTLTVAGKLHCIENMKGTLSANACESLPTMFNAVFQKTVEEITFLVNLPF